MAVPVQFGSILRRRLAVLKPKLRQPQSQCTTKRPSPQPAARAARQPAAGTSVAARNAGQPVADNARGARPNVTPDAGRSALGAVAAGGAVGFAALPPIARSRARASPGARSWRITVRNAACGRRRDLHSRPSQAGMNSDRNPKRK